MKVEKNVWKRIEHLRKAARFMVDDGFDIASNEAAEIALSLSEFAGSLEAHAHLAEKGQ